MAYAELIHPADRDRVWEQIQQALYRREPFRLSYRIITAAGEERWVLEQGRGVFDTRGAVQALEGFITDITDRKQTEELLQLSEARYRAIIESQTDLLCRFLSNGMLTFVNDAYCGYFACPRDAILATDLLAIVPEPDRDTVRAHIAQCTHAHKQDSHHRFRLFLIRSPRAAKRRAHRLYDSGSDHLGRYHACCALIPTSSSPCWGNSCTTGASPARSSRFSPMNQRWCCAIAAITP
jgi:PAS domain S-box-containing protein